jgi:hypothetical protein
MNTIDLVTAVINGDKEAAETAFNASLADKVTDALEVKKVEIATNLVTPEETDETTDIETEDSGAESVDDSADESATEAE